MKSADEILMLIKTQASLFDDVKREVSRMHSASLPEIIAVPIEKGLYAYLDWIRTNTKPPY